MVWGEQRHDEARQGEEEAERVWSIRLQVNASS